MSQLFVHNSGQNNEKIPVALDISVFNIGCKCK